MEYVLDFLISFIIFSITLATFFTVFMASLRVNISLPNKVKTLYFDDIAINKINKSTFIIKSKSGREMLITCVIVGKSHWKIMRVTTPCKLIVNKGSWLIIFSGLCIKVVKKGLPLHAIISPYGVNVTLKPFVKISGISYEIVPNFKITTNINIKGYIGYSGNENVLYIVVRE